MKTLHIYLLRQALSTLAMTVCVFAFILLLGNILREILALLVNRQASLFLILKAIALLMPWIMAYVLPFAMLTAMLLLFGRLSADNELTAIKASGISLLSLIAPLLIFAVLVSGVCAWFNLQITPQARVAYKRIVTNLGVQNLDSLITEERIVDELPGIVLYVRRKKGDLLEDVYIYQREKADTTSDIVSRTRAAQARVKWDRAGNKVTFDLVDGITEQLRWLEVPMFEAAPAIPATNFLSTNVLQSLTNVASGKPIGVSRFPEWHQGQFGGTQIQIALTNLDRVERSAKITDMTFWELRRELAKRKQQGIGVTPILVQMHRQIAFSFASFAFTLVAIPLGIQAHRRETSIGMAISLVLVFIYYSFLILSEALQMRERLHPQFIVWIPNLIFQTLGAILLWRANRKG
jgi:lipopolysaccharide export system permease protein